MAESWRARLKREAAEMHAALRPVLARALDDKQLREQIEQLALRPRFAELTYVWGPVLYERNRVLFRPFILSNFSSLALDAKGELIDPWKGESARALESWFAAIDAADDIELARRLYGWRLASTPWKKREATWRDEVVRRFAAAQTPAERFVALAKVDTGWMTLDAKTAAALYELDRMAARPFIMGHLPWFGWLGGKRNDWDELLARARDTDPEFHFELYRRVVDPKRWRTDAIGQCRAVADPSALDAELERRHPHGHLAEAADVFHELVVARGRDVVPYVLRHVGNVVARYGFVQREAKGLTNLVALADERDWLDLWGALLRTGASKELFDAEVRRLVRSKLSDADVRTRLAHIAGHGREANFPGISFAQVHPLTEATALELYRRLPDVVRGPFRMHVAPGWHDAYPKLVGAAIEAGDRELVDFFASRAALQVTKWAKSGWDVSIDRLAAHYEALPEPEFVARAANALSRMPAFAVWNYDELLRGNRLARLLFERSTSLYLADAGAIRDLLESPQIHVQMLAFRVLGRDDPRAAAVGAANVDLLQATLLRPLHRRTRLFAFAALERTASHDEATARYLLGRMRDALALPDKRYPTEKLIGLIGKLLHRWPQLRSAREVPRIYGEVDA